MKLETIEYRLKVFKDIRKAYLAEKRFPCGLCFVIETGIDIEQDVQEEYMQLLKLYAERYFRVDCSTFDWEVEEHFEMHNALPITWYWWTENDRHSREIFLNYTINQLEKQLEKKRNDK